MRKISSTIVLILLLVGSIGFNINSKGVFSNANEISPLEITSRSAVLMEPETGTIIYEKNSHEQLKPASVTKIMTLLLIYEAIDSGQIKWEDEVITSDYASSMGGSQVYLEAGEMQTAATLTKCIAVASANDAAVTMAEYIGGSEDAFAGMMNNRAKELGMKDTNFENASGLDSDNHYTSAYDIALMARELTVKHPAIFELSAIWMDTIIHNTARGSEEFGLTNTNKLIQWYEGATGLKTGSTSLAKYCLAGTATRKNMDLLAIVMAAPDYKVRFQEVMKMFDYGFAVCKKYEDVLCAQPLKVIEINRGIKDTIEAVAKEDFHYTFVGQNYDENKISKEVILPDSIDAPIKKDQVLGSVVYSYDGKEIGKVDIMANADIERATLVFYIKKIIAQYFY